MLNSKQIQTTPNNDEGNKFTFKGMLIYYIKIILKIISGCNWRYKCRENKYNKAFNGRRIYSSSSNNRSRLHLC